MWPGTYFDDCDGYDHYDYDYYDYENTKSLNKFSGAGACELRARL